MEECTGAHRKGTGPEWTRLQEIWDDARARREKKRREEERKKRGEEEQRARALESHRKAVEENYRRFKQAIREGRQRSKMAAATTTEEKFDGDGDDTEAGDGQVAPYAEAFDKGYYGEAMRIMPGHLAERPPLRPHILVPLEDAPEAPPEVAESARGLAAKFAPLPISAPAAVMTPSVTPTAPIPATAPVSHHQPPPQPQPLPVVDYVPEEEEEEGEEGIQAQAVPVGVHMCVMVRPYDDDSVELGGTSKRKRRQWSTAGAPAAFVPEKTATKAEPLKPVAATRERALAQPPTGSNEESDEEEHRAFAEKILRDRAKRAQQQQQPESQKVPQVPPPQSTASRPRTRGFEPEPRPAAGKSPRARTPVTCLHEPAPVVEARTEPVAAALDLPISAEPTPPRKAEDDRLYSEIGKIASQTSQMREDDLLRMAVNATKRKQPGEAAPRPSARPPPASSQAAPKRQLLVPNASRSRTLQPPPTTPLTEREQALKQSLAQLTAVCERHSSNLEKIAEELSMLRLSAERAQDGIPVSVQMPTAIPEQVVTKTPTVPPKSTAQARLPRTKAGASQRAPRRRQVSHGNASLVAEEPEIPRAAGVQQGGGRITLGGKASQLV